MNTVFDPIVSEFDSSDHEAEYNVWFRAKIENYSYDCLSLREVDTTIKTMGTRATVNRTF